MYRLIVYIHTELLQIMAEYVSMRNLHPPLERCILFTLFSHKLRPATYIQTSH